jgi:hypothetical protein
MMRLASGADTDRLEQVLADLRNFVDGLHGCSGFHHGPNRDFENKSPGFAIGFTLDAQDAEALAAYAVHPTHRKIGAELVGFCEGGADGIIVFDIETGP